MNLSFKYENNSFILRYEPDRGVGWIDDIFNKKQGFRIKGTFKVYKQDLWGDYDDENDMFREFKIGEYDNDNVTIYADVLEINKDVIISTNHNITHRTFVAHSGISIFSRFEQVTQDQIIISDTLDNALPIAEFEDLIRKFPTQTEVKHYQNARISNVLSQYYLNVQDSQQKLDQYLKKKLVGGKRKSLNVWNKYEYEKYLQILETLKDWLKNAEQYSEDDWQDQILEIILLLYPKYIRRFKEVRLDDYYSNPPSVVKRRIDIMLVDANGAVDVIEIKKPFENCVITSTKYRDNYTPLKALSGSVMQVEKYLFHLNKWGVTGESYYNKKYAGELPAGLNIKITSPKGIVILGREHNLSEQQLFDFELIKRKYANMIDILTYDDLIRRLENTLTKFA